MNGCVFVLALLFISAIIATAFGGGENAILPIAIVLFLLLLLLGYYQTQKEKKENAKPHDGASAAPKHSETPLMSGSTNSIDDHLDDDEPEDFDPFTDELDPLIKDKYYNDDFFDEERPLTYYELEIGPKTYNAAIALMNRGKRLCRTMSRNHKLREALNAIAKDSGNDDDASFNVALQCFLVQDIVKCFNKLGHEADFNYDTPQGQLLYAMMSAMLKNGDTGYSAFKQEMLFDDEITADMRQVREDTLNAYTQTGVSISNTQVDDFSLALLLAAVGFEQQYLQQVRELLYQAAELIAGTDEPLDDKQQAVLTAMKLQAEQLSTISQQVPLEARQEAHDDTNSPSLNELVGLSEVKKQVNNLKHFVEVNRKREAMGMPTPTVSLHCVFTGNPGTGKTTVARIIASLYKSMGILKKGHLVETDRSGLVAEYVGQTAVKTNKIIDSALDGVLFIDEAYTLVQGSKEDFGSEAIATLLKRMEDDRERLVVILAGYGKEIEDFINSNPGLRSRFNRYIHFPDYTHNELYRIFLNMAGKYNFTLSNEAQNLLQQRLKEAVEHKDKNFGNARFVRNVFEKTLEAQAVRLGESHSSAPHDLTQITATDIERGFETQS